MTRRELAFDEAAGEFEPSAGTFRAELLVPARRSGRSWSGAGAAIGAWS